MPKFLLAYRNEPMTSMPSPEEMQQILKVWNDWIGKFMQTGQLVDPGDGLRPQTKIVRGTVVSDGPLVEAKEVLGGYSVVQAENIDEAVKVALECPAAQDGSIEIREFFGWA